MNRRLPANLWRVVCLVPTFALVVGCSDSTTPSSTTTPTSSIQINPNPAVLASGQALYRTHCATCHGGMAQGAPNWHKRGSDGKFPPPPLNGTGHTWHHPHSQLVGIVKHGTLQSGGNMPSWKDKLTDADIDAILVWLRSSWPPEIYTQWQKMDQSSRVRPRN